MSEEARARGQRDVVQVYRQLSAQDRWIGVAYDVMGGVIATASRGTRRTTRSALQQALQNCSVGFVATVAPPAARAAAAPEPGTRRRQRPAMPPGADRRPSPR
jgi:hypothetical protein